MRHRRLQELLKCKIVAYRKGSDLKELRLHENVSMLLCRIGFLIEVQDLDNRGTMVLITKWARLGSRTTPLKLNFSSHRNGFRSLYGAIEGSFIQGSIRSTFEEQRGPSLVELTECNKEKILWGLQQGFRTTDELTRPPSFKAIANPSSVITSRRMASLMDTIFETKIQKNCRTGSTSYSIRWIIIENFPIKKRDNYQSLVGELKSTTILTS